MFKRIKYPTGYSSKTSNVFLIAKTSKKNGRLICDLISYNFRIQFWVASDGNGNTLNIYKKKSFYGSVRLYAFLNSDSNALEIYATSLPAGDYCVMEYLNLYQSYDPNMIWSGRIESVSSLPSGATEIPEA